MSQNIDLETVKEFMKETLDKVDEQHLILLAKDLEIKSNFFKSILSKENIDKVTKGELEAVLKLIFSAKRKTNQIFKQYDVSEVRSRIKNLLFGEEPLQKRFQKFCNDFKFIGSQINSDIAAELLHFTNPAKYWLWTRWMWDPKIKTGSLPLVITEEFDINGYNSGAIYMKVGHAVAFVHSMSEMGGYQFISKNLFGTNVFLSCVYVIYAYTILKMRMTQEFNNVMPGVIEFSRRILGIYRISEMELVVNR